MILRCCPPRGDRYDRSDKLTTSTLLSCCCDGTLSQGDRTMDSIDLKRAAWQVALSAATAAIAVFMFKLVKMRMIFYRLKKQGMVRSLPQTCRES